MKTHTEEIARLRAALEHIARIAPPCMSSVAGRAFGREPAAEEWRIVLGACLLQAKQAAREALTEDPILPLELSAAGRRELARLRGREVASYDREVATGRTH